MENSATPFISPLLLPSEFGKSNERRFAKGAAVVSAVREIRQRLQANPLDFGDPLYRLPALRMQVRHGTVHPLFINFAVCEDQPLVFIKGVELLPKRPA